jgi:hypothetical protein
MSKNKPERPDANSIELAGNTIEWQLQQGTCTFNNLPMALMWVDTTLAGLMSGVQATVGAERFVLALQSEGRKSVEADWEVISKFPDFREGFAAIADIAAVAGWGIWKLIAFDPDQKECRFQITDNWEGRYQKALGVCWGSGMLAGKLAGYCTKLFGTNCWADQSSFAARGDDCDEFIVKPLKDSSRQRSTNSSQRMKQRVRIWRSPSENLKKRLPSDIVWKRCFARARRKSGISSKRPLTGSGKWGSTALIHIAAPASVT